MAIRMYPKLADMLNGSKLTPSEWLDATSAFSFEEMEFLCIMLYYAWKTRGRGDYKKIAAAVFDLQTSDIDHMWTPPVTAAYNALLPSVLNSTQVQAWGS